jgi:hypothetical protein
MDDILTKRDGMSKSKRKEKQKHPHRNKYASTAEKPRVATGDGESGGGHDLIGISRPLRLSSDVSVLDNPKSGAREVQSALESITSTQNPTSAIAGIGRFLSEANFRSDSGRYCYCVTEAIDALFGVCVFTIQRKDISNEQKLASVLSAMNQIIKNEEPITRALNRGHTFNEREHAELVGMACGRGLKHDGIQEIFKRYLEVRGNEASIRSYRSSSSASVSSGSDLSRVRYGISRMYGKNGYSNGGAIPMKEFSRRLAPQMAR